MPWWGQPDGDSERGEGDGFILISPHQRSPTLPNHSQTATPSRGGPSTRLPRLRLFPLSVALFADVRRRPLPPKPDTGPRSCRILYTCGFTLHARRLFTPLPGYVTSFFGFAGFILWSPFFVPLLPAGADPLCSPLGFFSCSAVRGRSAGFLETTREIRLVRWRDCGCFVFLFFFFFFLPRSSLRRHAVPELTCDIIAPGVISLRAN